VDAGIRLGVQQLAADIGQPRSAYRHAGLLGNPPAQ